MVNQGQRSERWVVCSGLFVDPERRILKSAKRMFDIGEKALPLAGAAARLNDEGDDGIRATPVSGQLYCTLPLPDQVPLTFHVNGYFDLDSSRSQLTHGSELIGDAAIRVEWNAAMIQYAVTSAIADLMIAVSDRIEAGHLASYYDLWPDTGKLPAGPLGDLGRHLYSQLADGDFLHVRCGGDTSWRSTRDARVPAPQWSTNLTHALMLDGLALIEPLPPDYVLQSFTSVNKAPRAWSAAEVNTWLRVTDDLDCALEEAPRACLRDRTFIAELVRFCSRERFTIRGQRPIRTGPRPQARHPPTLEKRRGSVGREAGAS